MNYKEAAAACTRGEIPLCTAACPFDLDIRNMVTRVARGSFDAVYRLLRDALIFPETALNLCPAPCADVCERNVADTHVNLRGLELAAIKLAKKKEPLRLNVPPKTERVAVIGAGISGLACALVLSLRHYKVTVYEKSGRLGGKLWEHFPDGGFIDEIQLQFKHTACEFRLSGEIKSLSEIEADAVYVATGQDGQLFDGSAKALFYGGGICGTQGVFALKQGVEAANSIEAFLKTGAKPTVKNTHPTVTHPDPELLVYTPPITQRGEYYSADEAILEAGRCIRCDCDICARRCPLINHFKRFPKRIAEETEGTVHPLDVFVNRLATRMVASCDQCGLCADSCPQGVDLCAIISGAKREMVSKGEFPKAFTEFWLDDMAHASENSFVLTPDPLVENSYMFFPGCQLGASNTRYVSETYKRLLKDYPNTVLLADCCGAPAFWAGDLSLYEKKSLGLEKLWKSLGSPTPVCACPTCAIMLKKILPNSNPISLYSLSPGELKPQNGLVSVFDPCSSRFDSQAQNGVRRILELSGFSIRPLKFERENTLCCGWGGQYMIANPQMSALTAQKNAGLSAETYVTYCINCKETIAGEGKQVLHILDILLDIDPNTKRPTHSERRKNREFLKSEMTNALPDNSSDHPVLLISDSLSEKLSADWILEKDLLTVILHCENNNSKLLNTDSGTFIGHLQLGYQTYWVEYKHENANYRLVNAYSHRLVILEEL